MNFFSFLNIQFFGFSRVVTINKKQKPARAGRSTSDNSGGFLVRINFEYFKISLKYYTQVIKKYPQDLLRRSLGL